MSGNSKDGTARALNLPPYMEARPMKSGGYTYRVQLEDGSKVALGWNLQEALTEYQRLRGRFMASDQSAAEILTRHRKGAKRRGLEFSLTVEDVQAMLERQAGRCAVTQKPFNNTKPAGQKIKPWAASLDRKNCDVGYINGNCRLVCASVNIAMNRFGEGAFMELLESMVRRAVREELVALGVSIPMWSPAIPIAPKS